MEQGFFFIRKSLVFREYMSCLELDTRHSNRGTGQEVSQLWESGIICASWAENDRCELLKFML